jgi:hypothetical protein
LAAFAWPGYGKEKDEFQNITGHKVENQHPGRMVICFQFAVLAKK